MPKEIKSAATKDSSFTASERNLQASYQHREAPSKLSKDEQYEQDLHSPAGSLEKQAQQRRR